MTRQNAFLRTIFAHHAAEHWVEHTCAKFNLPSFLMGLFVMKNLLLCWLGSRDQVPDGRQTAEQRYWMSGAWRDETWRRDSVRDSDPFHISAKKKTHQVVLHIHHTRLHLYCVAYRSR